MIKFINKMMKPQKRRYNPKIDYIEDMDNCNRFEILLTIPSDPIWYRTILALICLEAFYIYHLPIIYHENMNSTTENNIKVLEFVFNLMYLVDIILSVLAMKVESLPSEPLKLITRHPLLLIIELISIIPVEIFFNVDDAFSQKIYYFVKLIHTLKLLRLFYHFHMNKFEFDSCYLTRLTELVLILAISQCIFVVVFHLMFCLERNCKRGTYYTIYEVISTKINGKGVVLTFLDFYNISIWEYDLEIVLSILIMHMWVEKPMICYMICGLIAEYEHKINYVYKVKYYENIVVPKFNISEGTCKTVLDYFAAFWKQRGGFTTKEMADAMSVYSTSLRLEMRIDSRWNIFRHSGIFRSREVYFLRFLTSLMKVELHMPSELLYERNVMKNKMFYIGEGIVDVMSNENGKCGIFSMTAGSCLGESTLFIPYKSSVNFRCQTVCKIHVLSKDDFILIQKKYPGIYKILLEQILTRYKEAKQLYEEKMKTNKASRDLVGLKTTIHGLMSKGEKYQDDHQIKNIYLANDINHTRMNQNWNTKKYIDLLVLKDRSQSFDYVFIKSTGMWILHPNSPILNIWEYIIILLTVTATTIIPLDICKLDVPTGALWIVEVIWIIDLLLQVIIPLNEDSDAKTIKSIFSERCSSPLFILDAISVFPAKIFSIFFEDDFNSGLLELNKLLKLYRLKSFFDKLESHFKINIIYVRFFKFICLFTIEIYFISCFFVTFGIDEHIFSVLSIQVATGVGFVKFEAQKQTILFLISNNIALLFELFIFISITSAFYLTYVTKLKVYNFIANLLACVNRKVKNPEIMQRLESFINTQINDNKGLKVITSFQSYFDLPVYFNVLTKTEYHLKYLLKLEMFADVPIEILQKLTTSANMMTFHKHANIVNRGVIYKEVYVLISGRGRTICGKSINFTKPGVPINMLEISYGTPAVCTVIGLTEVLMLTFNFTHLLHLLKSENVRLFDNFHNAFAIKKQESRLALVKILKGEYTVFVHKRDERKKSFYMFQGRNIQDSYDEFDYYVPFDSLQFFGWIRFFLMTLTIYPEGAFMFYWDFSRSILAFISSISYMVSPLSMIRMGDYWHIYFYIFDAAAFIDIYVRMHVCYYNEVGILIKHPLYTAKHYFKYGFLGDLLGAIPFNLIKVDCLFCKTLFNLMRAIQMHRVIGFKYSCNKNTLYSNLIFVFVWIIIMITVISSMIFAMECILEDNKLTCEHNFEPLALYVHLIFTVTSVITSTGLEGMAYVIMHNYVIRVLVSLITVGAIFAKILLNGYILSNYLKKDIEIYKYRTGLKNLYKWMQYEKASPYIKMQSKIYYNIYWKRIGESNPYQYFRYLNKSLKRDLLYNFYGDVLVEHSIFPMHTSELQDLYKNFLLEMMPLIIPRDGYVFTINDIEKNVYFLYSGDVDVVAPDGTCLNRLREGSLFGNLENTEHSRQKISIVANTHVQVFYMKTTQFYSIIEYFPEIKQSFLEQKTKYDYYIKSPLEKPEETRNLFVLRKGWKRYKKFQKFKTIYEVGLYFNLLVQIYQISTFEVHLYFLLFQLYFDIIHIIYEVLKFFVGYLDENHDLVTDPKLIRERYMTRSVLAISIISSIPFEMFALIIDFELSGYPYLIIIFLLNRLLRCRNMIVFQIYRFENFPCDSQMILRLFLLSYFIILSAAIAGSVLIHLDRIIPDGGLLVPLIENRQLYFVEVPVHLNGHYEKFYTFFKYFYFNLTLFIFTKDGNYKSESILKIFILTTYMLFWSVYNVLIFSELMKLASEYCYPKNSILHVIKYYEYYSNLKDTSNIIKKQAHRALVNIWNYSHDKNIKLLTENSPKYLKQAILYSVYGHVLYANPIFHFTHIDFLRQLIGKATIAVFFAQDVIVFKNDDRETIYFVHSGNVAVLKEETDCNDQALEILEKGDCFGLLQGLYTNKVYDYTYRALNTCEIVVLELKKWIYLLDFFPATKEFIYSNISAYENYSSVRRMPKKVVVEKKQKIN